MGTNNTIKVSLIQNVSVVSDTPILQTAVRALNGETNLVTFQLRGISNRQDAETRAGAPDRVIM